MTAKYLCYYCCENSDSFKDVIKHTIETHSQLVLKIKVASLHPQTGLPGHLTKNFNIIPGDCVQKGETILPSDEFDTIEIVPDYNCLEENLQNLSIDESDVCSPFAKKGKTSTPISKRYDDSSGGDTAVDDVLEEPTIADRKLYDEIILYLPGVIKSLRASGQLDTWLQFNKLLSEGTFPVDNIAYLLFLDVCKFYSKENTKSMRYDPIVKRFWRIGYRLFHGKWLRFMSGPKNAGNLLSHNSSVGKFNPLDAKINFVVPVRGSMEASLAPVTAEKLQPGIIHVLLDKVAQNAGDSKTFKLCLDGKKINASTSGTYGDIDLFGFEKPPTVRERKEQLEIGKQAVSKMSEYIEDLLVKQKRYLSELNKESMNGLCNDFKEILCFLGKQLCDLRNARSSREVALEKLKKEAGPDWRKSKLVYVISGLETYLHDNKACCDNILGKIDVISYTVSTIQNTQGRYKRGLNGVEVQFDKQQNYAHLTNYADKNELRYLKQRTPEWFDVRKTAKITGSTMHDALGLSTLKKQIQHFDEVVYNVKKPEPSSVSKEMMAYGSENEIHSVATLIAKVLPVYFPHLLFAEEGCYKRMVLDVPIVISPDGSCRSGDIPIYAVEIKCRFPKKVSGVTKLPVFYELPKYYVPQVLSEMKALGTDQLLFISYSPESSVVLRVKFSEDLWSYIESEIISVYSGENPCRPCRRSQSIPIINDKIACFVKENVEFLCEVPSVQGKECVSCISTNKLAVHSDVILSPQQPILLKEIKQFVHDTEVCIDTSFRLCRTRATEFLGFMMSDLDREYNPESLQSVPIAYGLKGYSLPTETLRQMLHYILTETFKRGLYVPVCSFDGQWYKLTVRDAADRPLTLLQLQKDTYTEVKRINKGAILKTISEMNIVKAADVTELKQEIDLCVLNGQYIVGKHKSSSKIILTSRVVNMIKKKTKQASSETRDSDNVAGEATEEIVNSLPDDVTVDESILESVRDIVSSDISDLNTDMEEQSEDSLDTMLEVAVQSSDDIRQHSISQTSTRPESISHTSTELKVLTLEDITEINNHLHTSNPEKWKMSAEELKLKFVNANSINQSFTKSELWTCLKPVMGKLKANGIKCNSSSPKYCLVNILSSEYGDGSNIEQSNRGNRKLRNPLTLACLAKKAAHQITKEHLNIIYAEHIFPSKLSAFYHASPFGSKLSIENIPYVYPSNWYSMPEYNQIVNNYLFMVLDAYHQFCGARRLFCGPGIPKAGISSKAIHEVASNAEINKCGLSLAHVRDMIDKQSAAYAHQTFNEKVEKALEDLGAVQEAEFCRLIREWYLAEDQPGISAFNRCKSRLALREWLLKDVKFHEFPPSGAYVKDIPIVLYEGLLTGIERRLQLFPFTKTGNYNVRTIGSLDIENFFCTFQDMDPKGTGVLRPDDIPTALAIAVEILDAKMDTERGFHVQTTRSKAYPMSLFSKLSDPQITSDEKMDVDEVWRDLSVIQPKDHAFDTRDRVRGKRKRKTGEVSKPWEPARKPSGVREYHRAQEAKILPHVRRGLNLNIAE